MKNRKLSRLLKSILASAVLTQTCYAEVISAQYNNIAAANASELQRVVYIWPQPHVVSPKTQTTQEISSDEYWQTVTGAELNRGTTVYAGNSALVRIAPMQSTITGVTQVSPSLPTHSLAINNSNVELVPLAAQKDMEAAGFRDGSIAFTVKSDDSQRKFNLKSSKPLASHAKYLVHVKEKGSAFKLDIAASRITNSGSEHGLTLNANINGNQLPPFTTKVSLLAPNGEKQNAKYDGNRVSFQQPLEKIGAADGFYQVEISSLVRVDGQWVKRSARFPFVNKAQTATLNRLQSSLQRNIAQLSVMVREPGRYNIRATLQGTTPLGKTVRLQTLDLAQWFNDDELVSLPFEFDKFRQYQDLKLVDIRLSDQTRMMEVQYLSSL